MKKEIAELISAVDWMLNVFDRGLPDKSIGRKVCDDVRKAIAKVKKSNKRA